MSDSIQYLFKKRLIYRHFRYLKGNIPAVLEYFGVDIDTSRQK